VQHFLDRGQHGDWFLIPSHVINLDRHRERWLRLPELASKIGWRIARLDAVDATSMAPDELQAAAATDPVYPLSAAEIACTMSPVLAWRTLLESDEPFLAVFEDDVEVDPLLVRLLDDTSWIPADAEVVKLETFLQRVFVRSARSIAGTDLSLARLGSVHYGTAGYIISRSGARRLLQLSASIDRTTDDLMFDARALWSHKLKVYQVTPALCVQAGRRSEGAVPAFLASSIVPVRRIRSRPSLPGLILRETVRPLRQFWTFMTSTALLQIAGYRRCVVPFSLDRRDGDEQATTMPASRRSR
jgi:glycosyl transferase family 25